MRRAPPFLKDGGIELLVADLRSLISGAASGTITFRMGCYPTDHASPIGILASILLWVKTHAMYLLASAPADALGGGVIVTASITNDSVDSLGLKDGMNAIAVIKAFAVEQIGGLGNGETPLPFSS